MNLFAKLPKIPEGYRVDWKEQFAFYFSALFRDMSYALTGYLSYFYIDVMGLGGVALAVILVVTRIFDGLNDPVLGIYYDRRKFTDGKAKPFFKYLAIPGAIALVMMFSAPKFSPDPKIDTVIKVVYAILTYCVFESMQTVNGTAFMSLYNSISDNFDERSKIISVARMFSTVGNAAVGGMIPILLSFFNNDDVLAKTYIYFGVACLVGAAFFLYNFLMSKYVKERVLVPHEENIKLKELFRSFMKNKLLLLMMLSSIISGLLSAGNTSMYFYQYNMGNPALMTLVGIITAPALVVATVLVPVLAKRFNKRTIILSCTAMTLTCHIAYLIIGYKSIWVVILYNVLVNIPNNIRGIIYWNMIADSVDYAEWKTGYRNDGMIYSIEGVLGKVIGGIGSMSTAIILSLAKFVPNAPAQTEEAMQGLFRIPLIITILSTALAAIPYCFYTFSRREHARVLEELKQRKESKELRLAAVAAAKTDDYEEWLNNLHADDENFNFY